MKKLSLLAILGTVLVSTIRPTLAQTPTGTNLYMPLDIKKAYENGSRSYLGIPGENYWENTCSYKIQADMDLKQRTLKGKEWIEYNNNSPDTLKNIVLNTYLDVYQRGSQRNSSLEAETKGFSLSLVVIDSDTLAAKDLHHMTTFYNIPLVKPLVPHTSCIIEIAWTVDFVMPPFSREGFADSTSAFIGYWYPKIAVYDDIFGWNYYTYTLKDEFYSPLADYDVSISLPEGFFVWATGTLMNPGNYPKIISDRIKNTFQGSNTVAIIDTTTVLDPTETGKAPWRYRADSVPDFAFAFSDHFLWDACVVSLKARKVLINTVYPREQSAVFRDFNRLVKFGMELYSFEDPGVEFPYPCFTTFYGLPFSGMEYPMMSFEGVFNDTAIDADVAIHEMLHTYMPFYVRTNETRFGWMDEGITSFYAAKAEKKLGLNYDYLYASFKKYYPGLEGTGNLPLLTPTSCLGGFNGGGMQYIKPVDMLVTLEDLVGKESWRNCYKAFTETWKYRSPMTYDFIFFTSNFLKQDLFWFWDTWFMHFGYPDLSVFMVDKDRVTIENKGGLPIPFKLVVTAKNGKQTETAFHADCWKNGPLCEIGLPAGDPVKVEVKCDLVEDYDLKNNVWNK